MTLERHSNAQKKNRGAVHKLWNSSIRVLLEQVNSAQSSRTGHFCGCNVADRHEQTKYSGRN